MDDTSIHLICEHCGAQIKAPRSAGGQRHSCPQCENSVYIPTPEDELELLPFAEENEAELLEERQLEEERRQLDVMIAHESSDVDESVASSGHRGTVAYRPASTGSTESLVLQYLTAMRDTDLDGADRAMMGLKQNADEARKLVESLTTDQIPPPVMANVPPGVYQGFLKNLLSKL